MDFWCETNWYAVQTKPHHEQLAAASVAKLDVEAFLPRIKQEQSVCGVPRLVTKSLFLGYFFARLCPLLSYDAVRYALGVLRVVGTSRFPIPVEEQIISSIKEHVHADGFIRLERKPFLAGDQVSIEQGPFAGWMGKVEHEWDDGKRVLILLNAIDHARLLIEKRWLRQADDP